MLQPDQSNLIDLDNGNRENVEPISELPQPELQQPPQILSPENILIRTLSEKRDSLDNNPFDNILRQVRLKDDPFESVAYEAEKQKPTSVENPEVKTVNLLGLDEESGENESQIRMDRLRVSRGNLFELNRSNALSSISSMNSLYSPTNCDDSVFGSNISPICTETANSNVFNNAFVTEKSCEQSLTAQDLFCNGEVLVKSTESPQLENSNFTTGNSCNLHSASGPSDSNKKISGEISALNVAHFSGSIRTHLLKLSLSNSSTGSSLRRSSRTSDDITVFTEAGCLAEQLSKIPGIEFDDSCDDINALKPNWVDSETEQDSDLELLRIPILEEMEKATVQQRIPITPSKKTIEVLEKHKEIALQRQAAKIKFSDHSNLQENCDEVKRHKLENANSQDVNDLINSLKGIVFECPNGEQKSEANKLLENLSTLLCKDTTEKNAGNHLIEPEMPPMMVRQGTFHLEKSKKEEPQTHVAPEPEVSTSPQLLSEVTNIAEEIGKLLGNQNMNVLQANFGGSSATATNPTYIVVMGTTGAPQPCTPVRKKTEIDSNSSTSPVLDIKKRVRSYSLSIHDKPIKCTNMPPPASVSICKTPIRSGMPQRRSSFSYLASSNTANTRIQKPTYGPTAQPKTTAERIGSVGHHRIDPATKIIPNNNSNMRSDLKIKSLKLKTTEPTRRTIGPLKATIPVKKVAPMIITPSVSSPIETYKKSNLITSTPNPDKNSLKKFPVACSTPVSDPSPKKVKSKLRYSNISATPNPKSNVKPTSSVFTRRRSLTDCKPTKRLSTAGSTKISIGGYQPTAENIIRRLPSKVGVSVSKSDAGPILEKNKENTHPK